MSQEDELTQAEAILALAIYNRVGGSSTYATCLDGARTVIRYSPPEFRAALARGPGGASTKPVNAVAMSADFIKMESRALAAEARVKELESKLTEKENARRNCWDDLVKFQHERDRLAGELERTQSKLTDAALVEAGWVPKAAAHDAMSDPQYVEYRYVLPDLTARTLDAKVSAWLSRRAAPSAEPKGGA